MIPELIVLSLLLDRNTYKRYRPSINLSNVKVNMRNLYGVYLTLDKMFETIDAESFTMDEFEAYYWLQHPLAKKDEREEIQASIFIPARNRTGEVAGKLLSLIQERAIASQIALQAFEISTGKGHFSDLVKAITTSPHETISTETDIEFVTDDLNVLLDKAVGSGGLRWPLESLNRRLGPLRRGNLGCVFSRPEVGKTTFLAHAVACMGQQVETEILWFNNEEAGENIKIRIFQALLGRDIAWLLANREEANKQFLELTHGRIKLIDRPQLDYAFIERTLAGFHPSLVVIDKLDRIKGFAEERKDLVLGEIYRWAREVSKTYAPVIGVCHADGAAEGLKWLTMDHMDNAKTSKQEACDWILGIGQTHDEGMDYVRYFSLCKNKLMGDNQTDPRLRHDKWEVLIKSDIAQYSDLVKGK